MAFTFGALLPSRPAGAQSRPGAAFVFGLPSATSAGIQTQQAQDLQLCPEGIDGRSIIIGNVKDLAGVLVIVTVFATLPGVVQFSLSPNGPFTDTLEVPIQLDGTGSGRNNFFVKGVGGGATPVEGCSPVLGCVPISFISTVVGISSLTFAEIDSPLDTNPNIGGGLRIYPDRESPQDAVNRRTVRVQAFTNPPESGLPVTFRSFDVDDPSSDDGPVDPKGHLGDDNRGEPGTLSAVGAVMTDASGLAENVFTVSMQPGDNFKVAAACDPDYLNLVVVDAGDLKDANGHLLPTTQGNSTEMLTVWRRLHVEVDSMGMVTGNHVTGLVTDVVADQKSLTTRVDLDRFIEPDRFEGGLIEIAGFGLFQVTANHNSSVTLPGILTQGAGSSFNLRDDDDFNGDDSGPLQLDGDDGENVTPPSLDALADSLDDGVCNASSMNVFGPAYVCPVFDLIADHDDFAPFVLNVAAASNSALMALYTEFENRARERDATFWTVYLLGAYQYTTSQDFDPDPKGHRFEQKEVSGASDTEDVGAAIFKETIADKNRALNPRGITCIEALISAHEIGHLFGGDHPDGGIMATKCETIVPELRAKTIHAIRMASHP